MKKSEEITYLFGAGASYYSMPLVENFVNRFTLFRNDINVISETKNGFLYDCDEFREQLKSHLSFDTFFKKLFHLPGKSTVKYKSILLIFFLYEHLSNIANSREFKNPEVHGKTYGVKKGNIDPRYEALIAGLLKPIKNEFSLITKTNFLTWNYDCNLIASVKNFLNADLDLSVFIPRYETSINNFTINSNLQIIHLNGRVFHPKYSRSNSLFRNDLLVTMTALIKEYYDENSQLSYFSDSLKFSWETLSENEIGFGIPLHLKGAIEAIKRSSSIVIVGYSFPLYNRLIDAALINQENLGGKTIYIQDPRSADLRGILINDFGLLVSDRNVSTIGNRQTTIINAIDNCNSFFVPSDIYVSPLDPNVIIK